MWALFQCGRLVERLQGRTIYALTYLGSGIGGSLLSIDWHGDQRWSAGASGAIFGVYGALLGHLFKQKDALPRTVFHPIMKSTLIFAGYNLIYGMINKSIDNSAHVGGFATGIVLGWVTAMPPDFALRAHLWTRKLAAACVVLGAIIAAGVIAAPRFGYSPIEELLWADRVSPIANREEPLIARENEEMARWRKSGDNGAEFGAFIDRELLPYYLSFEQALQSLPLKAGRGTDGRRRTALTALNLKSEGLKHLSRAVTANEPGELAAYETDEKESKRLLQELSRKP
jgi:rhomboid protease GluP